jgi:hypothetical protein
MRRGVRGQLQRRGDDGHEIRGPKRTSRQQTFADGATLAELEKHLASLRSLGAPGDAHPRVGVNDDYEITWMTCVVERRTLDGSRR